MAVSFYDPTNPATREYVWELIRKNYVAHGIGIWWLDACEPELNPAHPANLSFFAGPGAQVANIYPRDNARLFAEGMASEGLPQTVLFSRSAWAGSQKYGAAVWSGDIAATWDSLTTQVRAGLEHRAVRHSLVDDRHRRFPRRRPIRPRLPGADHPVVPVRGLLPAVPASRRPRTTQL